MLEETKGTLFDDVVSLDTQEKINLVNWSITATKDVASKKAENKKTKKTIVELTTVDEVIYQIIAIKDKLQKPASSVEDNIKSLNLSEEVIERLIQKYDDGKITQNHVKDIKRTSSFDKIGDLKPLDQVLVTENIINNRNNYNDINSSETSKILIQRGMGDNNDIDNWYREMVRLIGRLTQYLAVNKEILNNLSVQQTEFLTKMISNLNVALEKFESGLIPEI